MVAEAKTFEMANAKRASPPLFSNSVTHKFWRSFNEMWTVICVVPQNNWKAERAVSTLTTADLHKETGFKILMCKLDDTFQD